MANGQKWDEFTEEQLRQLEARWKSDIEREVAEIRAIVVRLDEAFQRAHGALTVVKWGAATVGALGAAWAWATNHLTLK